MRYFEFAIPYYALIQARNEAEAVQEYIEVVAGDKSDFDTLLDEAKEVPEYYAGARFSRAKGEDGELMDLDEVVEILKEDKAQLLVIDGSLI